MHVNRLGSGGTQTWGRLGTRPRCVTPGHAGKPRCEEPCLRPSRNPCAHSPGEPTQRPPAGRDGVLLPWLYGTCRSTGGPWTESVRSGSNPEPPGAGEGLRGRIAMATKPKPKAGRHSRGATGARRCARRRPLSQQGEQGRPHGAPCLGVAGRALGEGNGMGKASTQTSVTYTRDRVPSSTRCPDRALCDAWLFPKLKMTRQGNALHRFRTRRRPGQRS